jgi:catechol 2,3-dioxygenase-like lactoylglutathione lyase family enzyme
MPKRRLVHVSLLVADYDEAIDFYVQKLDFVLIEDTPLTPEKRWVLVAPQTALSGGCALLLAKAQPPEQVERIGSQSGGRVFLFLETDDFDRDYQAFRERGVVFVRPPSVEPYGKVAVFEDLYGNLWDLIEYHTSNNTPEPKAI